MPLLPFDNPYRDLYDAWQRGESEPRQVQVMREMRDAVIARMKDKDPDAAQHMVTPSMQSLLSHTEGMMLRDELFPTYGFVPPTTEAIEAIANVAASSNGKIASVGAGTGYWEGCLKQAGCDVVACDLSPIYPDYPGQLATPLSNMPLPWLIGRWFPELVQEDAVSFASKHSDRLLMFGYPDMDDWTAKALEAYVKAGGERVAVTADPRHCAIDHFWHILEGQFKLVYRGPVIASWSQLDADPWMSIARDRLEIYERSARSHSESG